jgi:hypothetical protein
MADTQDTPEQIATQSVLTDSATGKTITAPFLVLKVNGEDYHFQNWESVKLWAESKIT